MKQPVLMDCHQLAPCASHRPQSVHISTLITSSKLQCMLLASSPLPSGALLLGSARSSLSCGRGEGKGRADEGD